jgi:hypothetical protein
MIESIESPVASAVVRWRSPEVGGRKSGPPSAPVYAANCSFPDALPENSAESGVGSIYSIFIQKVHDLPDGQWLCNLDFIAKALVAKYLLPGSPMLVMEGPVDVVGDAVVVEVFSDRERRTP